MMSGQICGTWYRASHPLRRRDRRPDPIRGASRLDRRPLGRLQATHHAHVPALELQVGALLRGEARLAAGATGAHQLHGLWEDGQNRCNPPECGGQLTEGGAEFAGKVGAGLRHLWITTRRTPREQRHYAMRIIRQGIDTSVLVGVDKGGSSGL